MSSNEKWESVGTPVSDSKKDTVFGPMSELKEVTGIYTNMHEKMGKYKTMMVTYFIEGEDKVYGVNSNAQLTKKMAEVQIGEKVRLTDAGKSVEGWGRVNVQRAVTPKQEQE